jgi:N-formylglutamate amidohydrolase
VQAACRPGFLFPPPAASALGCEDGVVGVAEMEREMLDPRSERGQRLIDQLAALAAALGMPALEASWQRYTVLRFREPIHAAILKELTL